MKAWIARNRQLVSVAMGLIAALVAASLGSAVAPRHLVTVSGLLARATAYTLLVFAAGAITTLCSLRIMIHRQAADLAEIALRTASPALWLPPLLMFSAQRSWFALVIWVVLAVEVGRLIAFVRGISEDDGLATLELPFPDRMFAVHSQPFVSGLGSVLGSVAIQAAVVAAIDNRPILTDLLLVVGTGALVHRGVQMIRDSPASQHPSPASRSLTELVVVTFVIAFAWLPYSLGAGGSGIGGNSFAAGRRLLGSTFALPAGRVRTLPNRDRNTREGTYPVVIDTVFTGVLLYPEVESHLKLVAPTLNRTREGFGSARSDPLSIPFDGVYWFWRPPADRPPPTSVLRHGSPAVQTFRSLDGAPLWMEARQNLGAAVGLGSYSAIEIVIDNADAFPGTVAMELQVRNTMLPGKPSESLGLREVSVPAGMNRGVPAVQTLSFRVPSQIKIDSFDELTVRYRLKWWRGDKSAKIAIDRFRLVPKG